MDINLKTVDGVNVLSVEGRFDSSCVDKYKRYVKTHLDDESNHFIFDLSGLDFIDSTGLGLLVYFLKRNSENNGTTKICGLGTKVQMVFEVTKSYEIFDIYDDIESALKEA
jgi:anti-sigma B factor antagonist